MLEVEVDLYGKPSWEMDIEDKEEFDVEIFLNMGDELKERLYEVADIIDKLQKRGFKCNKSYGSLYSLTFYPPEDLEFDSVLDLENVLMCIDIDLENICIIESD